MVTKLVRYSLVLTACLLVAVSAQAAVTLPSIIGNHMVLQQGKELPIWGKADPGEAIVVKLGDSEAKTTAGADGNWMVRLPRQHAKATPVEMTITGKDGAAITISDILIGEVWLGSGQSNMQWPVKETRNATEEIAAANFPQIRLFSVELKTAAEPQWNCKGEWVVCTPETVPGFSAVLFYFGRYLHQNLNTPMGLINTSWGGTPAESWTSRPTLEADPDLKHMVADWDKAVAEYPAAKAAYDAAFAEWEKACAKAKADGAAEPAKPGEPRSPEHPWRTSSLYNQMIHPLVPFALQGAIWYQGESNASRAYQYRKLFPAMIEDWRKSWNQGPFSFYFVQLANFTEPVAEPRESDWAELREAQTMTLSLPKTGMAVIIDIGEAKDIHPRNKQDVGKRLALNALAKDYGKPEVFSGPMYKSMSVKKDKAIVKFDYANGLNAQGGELKGFAIAGADKKFVWAKAEIKGEKVVVSADGVTEPVAVRYGWANNPPCNLYNGAGLPASPFRTDDWPGLTVNNK